MKKSSLYPPHLPHLSVHDSVPPIPLSESNPNLCRLVGQCPNIEEHITKGMVKPFQKEQLYTAIEIAMLNISKPMEKLKIDVEEESISQGLFSKDALFIKEKFKYTKLLIDDMLWIKAEGNYLEIHLADRKELIRASLTSFLERIDRPNFFLTHNPLPLIWIISPNLNPPLSQY